MTAVITQGCCLDPCFSNRPTFGNDDADTCTVPDWALSASTCPSVIEPVVYTRSCCAAFIMLLLPTCEKKSLVLLLAVAAQYFLQIKQALE